MADICSVRSSSKMSENMTGNNKENTIPDTPPPEYDSIEQGGDMDQKKVCDVSAAIPLLIATGAFVETEKPPLPPDYTEVDIEGVKEGATEAEEGQDVPSLPPSPPSEEPDPWDLPDLQDNSPSWSELSGSEKAQRVVVCWLGKPVALIALLYLFVCSLDFLSSSFRLLGGKAAGAAFSDSELLQNPVVGLMIGVLATVLVQSSSTSTSIVVTMVAAGILKVQPAIPIVMGANIGTSVTNTIVSLAQSANKDEFRRAFGGATVHDMFNWLCVLVLLPLEAASGYLYLLTSAIVDSMNLQESQGKQPDLLKAVTKPFTSLVIKLDKKIIEKIALGDTSVANKSLIKEWCSYKEVVVPANVTSLMNVTVHTAEGSVTMLENVTALVNQTVKVHDKPCHFLFHATGMNDTLVGVLLLAVSLAMLCTCLVLLVKLLHSVLRGSIAVVIKRTINADFPGRLSFLTGYMALLVGAGMTILVQSSSVFTSAMTPLVGVGVIKLERMYPLTLGSNIGTTATGLLAAMAASGDKLPSALQIALCHLFFNISGILLFYPIPAMRIPIKLAKIMGNTTADYRWFAILYVVMMFFLLPGTVCALSLAGTIPFVIVLSLCMTLATVVVIINILQQKRPNALPAKMRNWEFLPEWMHSLDPLDRVFRKALGIFRRCCPCCKCCQPKKTSNDSRAEITYTDISSDCSLLSSGMSTPRSGLSTPRSGLSTPQSGIITPRSGLSSRASPEVTPSSSCMLLVNTRL